MLACCIRVVMDELFTFIGRAWTVSGLRGQMNAGPCPIWAWVKIKPGDDRFSLCFHLPGIHFGYLFLTLPHCQEKLFLFLKPRAPSCAEGSKRRRKAEAGAVGDVVLSGQSRSIS